MKIRILEAAVARASLLMLMGLVLGACTPQVIVVTATPEPTHEPTETPTPTATSTATQTRTPRPTPTRRPTNTPSLTPEPRAATQTQQAVAREATRAFNQNIDDIKGDCPAIDWVELSEVEYARDHEGDCVYIKGRIRDVNFEEDLLELSIGFYSAEVAVGLGRLTSTPGRLTEDMWINVYGTVCTTCWVSTNRFTGDQTPVPGIDALLIEGPNRLIWLRE